MNITTALKGALLADSLALGPHWIYDTQKLEQKFGRVTELLQPDEESYHRGQPLGGQTHYGHQAFLLAQTLEEPWSLDSFRSRLKEFWSDSESYRDKATKNFLAGNEGSSDELGGATRFVAVVGAVPDRKKALQASQEQSSLTHSPKVGEVARQLTELSFRLVDGDEIATAVREVFAHSDFLKRAESVKDLLPTLAVKELGQGCALNSALPAVLYFLLRSEGYRETLIDNVMAGGDSASRGLPLGALLALAYPDEPFPASWLENSIICRQA